MKFKLLCEPNENIILFEQTKDKISFLSIMGTEGLEPSRTITRQRILSPSCLPIPPRPLYLLTEAAPRLELGIEDLQSTALPLGHTAINNL